MKARPWSVIRDEPVRCRVTTWVAYTLARFGCLIGYRERFNVFNKVVNKLVNEREQVLVSSKRCQIGAIYMHRCDLERLFMLLHFSERRNKFFVLISMLTRVTFPISLL